MHLLKAGLIFTVSCRSNFPSIQTQVIHENQSRLCLLTWRSGPSHGALNIVELMARANQGRSVQIKSSEIVHYGVGSCVFWNSEPSLNSERMLLLEFRDG